MRALALVVTVLVGNIAWASYYVMHERSSVRATEVEAASAHAVEQSLDAASAEARALVASGALSSDGVELRALATSPLFGADASAPTDAVSADIRGAALLPLLQRTGMTLPAAVRRVLAPLDADDISAVRSRHQISVRAADYEAAISYLRAADAVQPTKSVGALEALANGNWQSPLTDPLWLGAMAAALMLAMVGAVALRDAFGRGDAHAKRLMARNQRLVELIDVARRVSSETEYDVAVNRLLEEARSLVNADFAMVYQVDGNDVVPVAQHGVVTPAPVRIGQGVVGEVISSSLAVRARVVGDPAVGGLHGTVSLLAAPMLSDRQVVGALVVGSSFGLHFSADDEVAMRLFAIAAGGALENALAHEATAEMVNTDPLTGLANRRRLDGDLNSTLGNLLADGDPVAFAMVDVDHFKRFNDAYGHPAGDELLRQVAAAIASAVRSNDVVYRYGGEEFCVLLPGASAEEAHHVAERVRWAVATRAMLDDTGRPVSPVTVSVGVSCRNDLNTEALVAAADSALYAAKQNGRNCVVAA
jgi:diguanylate cyclase (GGDEF)-like protein